MPVLFGLRRRVLQQLHDFLVGRLAILAGRFGRVDAVWYAQDNKGADRNQPGDNFWQLNAYLGYRFPRRKAEIALGLLNLTDQDYRLNPLNLYNELPRTRTFVARLRLSF